jgi:HTH-type transcriptional repressor of NAD biosynthesis genes
MKRGLVIGKFLPIHQGHIALINFAASRCDELIVSMSAASTDVIDPTIRFDWLQQIFHHNARIKCFQIVDDFDDDTLPLDFRTKIWAAFIQKTYPRIDTIFSSEEYGEPFARHLNAEHIPFDQPRQRFPVSASAIRKDPFKYWQYIPPVVRPYFVKKLCFYGPESTGKTKMSEILAKRYDTGFVPEVARELITSNDFTADDIIRIGYAQVERVNEKLKSANKILFCDTDAITTQIYSEHYLHLIPEVLFRLEKEMKYDHYFLFDIDVAWVADEMRDLGERRREMFDVFRNGLEQRRIGYTLVRGDYLTRQQLIEAWIEEHYGLKPVN